MTKPPAKMYFYERFAKEFDSVVNMYDTTKRIKVVYEELLTQNLHQKKLLDAGCGTGWFSQAAVERGAVVTSMDVGPKLLKQVAKKCESQRVIGSIMEMPFKTDTFDVVVSSEVIEHVPNPNQALRECFRVLKPGGSFVVTTPNRFWYFALAIAEKMKLRPYQGLENWSGFDQLQKELEEIGFTVEEAYGIHLFPFTVSLTHPILDFFHQFRKPLGSCMVNIAIKCRKPARKVQRK